MRLRAARSWVTATLGALMSVLLVASVATADLPERDEALPNLVPVPGVIELGEADRDTGTHAIRLEGIVANRGSAHLDLLGLSDQGSAQRSTAYQCTAWTQDRVCSERTEVGIFVWHPEHGHHHFEDFAQYELRRLNKNGRPDMRPKGRVVEGTKVSYCLMDIQRDDEEGSGDFLGWPLFMSCLAGSGSQGISRGWRDVYSKTTTGQQIVVDDLDAGVYALVITIDPDNKLLETDDSDNTVAVKIELGVGGLTEHCVYDKRFRSCEPR